MKPPGAAGMDGAYPRTVQVLLDVSPQSAYSTGFRIASEVWPIGPLSNSCGDGPSCIAEPPCCPPPSTATTQPTRPKGKPYVVLRERWGYSGHALEFLTVDNTHPNVIGYGDMSTAVTSALLTDQALKLCGSE